MARKAGKTQVRVYGATTLAATLGRATAKLGDLSEVNQGIASYTATRARTYAPKKSGRLAASITGTGEKQEAVISSDLIYAGVQENGWPGHNIEPHKFMDRASSETKPAAVRAHVANVNRLLHTIKGI